MDGQKVQLLTFPEYVKERMETTCYREKNNLCNQRRRAGKGKSAQGYFRVEIPNKNSNYKLHSMTVISSMEGLNVIPKYERCQYTADWLILACLPGKV